MEAFQFDIKKQSRHQQEDISYSHPSSEIKHITFLKSNDNR